MTPKGPLHLLILLTMRGFFCPHGDWKKVLIVVGEKCLAFKCFQLVRGREDALFQVGEIHNYN